MVERTIRYILPDTSFKVLSASRTDAMVSSNDTAIALMTAHELPDSFMGDFNKNLPMDIRAESIKVIQNDHFNIIQTSKEKEYLYLFAHGQKAHPFAASLLTTFSEEMDIPLMKKGAKLFEGTHSFHNFCYKPSEKTTFTREISCSEIVDNTFYTASFFPEKTYAYRLKSKGFLRHQVRIMMGVLYKLGKGDLSLPDVVALLGHEKKPFWEMPLAPASGLILQSTSFPEA